MAENKIELPKLLEEFRLSLEAEIKAIKKNSSSSAVPLNSGRKLSESAGQYQYQFMIDSLINVPDGTPANLVVEDRQPIETSIISIEGNCIILSISENLGDFIPYARLESDLSMLFQRLINRIEKRAQDKNDAGERMLGRQKYSGKPKEPLNIALKNVSDAQKKAISSAIGRNATYIWGPPGTGKTTTIGKIIEELFRNQRTVLLVSHTNAAVDQAIISFSKSITSDELDSGSILRLGIPKNKELVDNYPQVLLENQKKRLSKELTEELGKNEEKKRELENDVAILEKQIINYNWCVTFENLRYKVIEKIEEFNDKSYDYFNILTDIETLTIEKGAFNDKIEECKEYMKIKNSIALFGNEIVKCKNKLGGLNEETFNVNKNIEEIECKIHNHNHHSELNHKLSKQISIASQKQITENLLNEIDAFKNNIADKNKELSEHKRKLIDSENSNAITRIFKGLKPSEQIRLTITNTSTEISLLTQGLNIKMTTYESKVNILNDCKKMKRELQELNIEGSLEELLTEKIIKTNILNDINDKIFEMKKILTDNEKNMDEKEKILTLQSGKFAYNPEDVLVNYNTLVAQILNKTNYSNDVDKELKDIKNKLTTYFERHIDFAENSDFNQLIKILDGKYLNLKIDLENFKLEETEGNIDIIKNTVADVIKIIDEIGVKLSEIEKQIIAEAKVIGATLTKAYLSDELQIRKFDTVILDEASMANVPALWATAYMAEKNIIIVGDFKQLAPIVISKEENALKWLGQDVFFHSGISKMYYEENPPENFVMLFEQYRMEKEIADIANIYYDNILESPESKERTEDRNQFLDWYNGTFENPITLLSTQSFNAWVTSVVRGGNTSRINILSATLCVKLAEELIQKYINNLPEKTETKVLIVSPYRPHAKFLELLIKDGKTPENIIRAGTVHSFQGSEADIVIFDLVVDEPHWRANLFMNTEEINEQMRRLFNVAITRAKFKLFIVGNFDYCLKKGKKSEIYRLLNELIENKKYKIYDAKMIFPKIVPKLSEAIIGGNLESKYKRLGLTGDSYYKFLFSDIKNAKSKIIIYSPFMGKDRLSVVAPQLQFAILRGVKVFVVTKAISDRVKGEIRSYIEIENSLKELGIKLLHKKGMHEKLVFIDEDIIWTGSLNTLSYSIQNPTEEVMERRESEEVFNDYIKLLKVNDLLEVFTSKIESVCPICGAEMIAAEGTKEPFYWRCLNDNCFTRGINQKYPINGEMTCGECNSKLEFSFIKEPRWKCTLNKRHYQKLFRCHLKLPKMLSKISKKEMKNLNNYLDKNEPIKLCDRQLSLFDGTIY